MSVRIREVTAEPDLAHVRRLCRGYRAALAEATTDRPHMVERYYAGDAYETLLTRLPELHGPPGAIFLGEIDREPLGCGMTHEIAPGVIEIKRVFTEPAARGKGLARALCVAAMDHARAGGAGRMVLDSMKPLTAAIRLYEGLGFTPCAPFYEPAADAADYLVFLGRDL